MCGVLSFVACGEDRTYELDEKTQHNHWMLDELRDKYLWGDSLNNFKAEWKDYFAKPADFLAKAVAKASKTDKWSYVEVDTIVGDVHKRGHFSHVESYGFDFALMTDPTGQTTKQFARVLTVYPHSPAAEAGLCRNDFISDFNGYKITAKNTNRLEKGDKVTFTVQRLCVEEEELTWSEQKTVALAHSRCVEDVAFPVHGVVEVGGLNVGYLMCTRLIEANDVEGRGRGVAMAQGVDGEYKRSLDAIMNELAEANVNEMVLDLRLCNYGSIDMACRLASYVVSPGCRNEVFANTVWNKNYESNNKSYPYDLSVRNLNLGRVYVLTSKYTQGAAEWLIHSLQSSMGEENVIVVGTGTAGQNVMTQEIGFEHHIHLNPVVAFVSDGKGDYNYGSCEPTFAVDEFGFAELYEYGEEGEPLLRTALEAIQLY